MDPCLHKDDSSGEFVEVDVAIKRKHTGKAHVTENCDGVTKDEAKYENWVEKESPACRIKKI